VILAAEAATLAITFLVLNLSSGERKVDHRIPHRYATGHAQFVRPMGNLLGPLLLGDTSRGSRSS